MKVLVSSDWHSDAVTAGVRRSDDLLAFQTVLLREAASADLVLLLGDFFDPGKMGVHEHTARMFDVLGKLARHSEVVCIAGNHDVVEGCGWTTLSPVASAVIHGFGGGRVRVVEVPQCVKLGELGLYVVALPYVSRTHAVLYGHDAMDELFRTVPKDQGARVLVAGHLCIPGAQLGNESEEYARGADIMFPVSHVAKVRPVAAFNGHYHTQQTVELTGGLSVHIPGSPHRYTFSDTGADKGFLVMHL
jgi:DNA repair exonuclease SbcCD nuclease subunit